MRRPADGPRTKGGAPPTVAKDEGCGPARSGERVTVTPVLPRLNYNCNMRAWRPGSSAHVLPASPIGRARGRRIGGRRAWTERRGTATAAHGEGPGRAGRVGTAIGCND